MLAQYLKRNDLRIVIKNTLVVNQKATVAYLEFKDEPSWRVYFQDSKTSKRSASYAIRGENGNKALCGLIHRLSTVNKPLFTVNTSRMDFDRLSEFNALMEFAYFSKLSKRIEKQLAESGTAYILG